MNKQQLSAGEPNPKKGAPKDSKAVKAGVASAAVPVLEGEDFEYYGEGFEGPPPPPPPSPAPTILHENKSTQIFTEPPKYVHKRNKIVQDGFGFLSGPDDTRQIIRRYTLKNTNGFRVQLINYGAIVTSIKCPDKVGRMHDVLLGFDNIEGYIQYQKAYPGAIIGRVANRIRDGKFNICRQEYELSRNWYDQYHLHGGIKGFDQVYSLCTSVVAGVRPHVLDTWSVSGSQKKLMEVLQECTRDEPNAVALWDTYVDTDNERVIMTYLSKNGEEGYPGDVMATVAYSISEDFELKIEMTATSNKSTPVNLTSHLYFNLAGHCAGPKYLKDHVLTVNADKYLVTKEDLIPTGEVQNVGGTIYDLRTPRQLGLMLTRVPGGGYDTTFCINGKQDDGIKLNARLRHPASGRVLEVFSDQPGLQVYTANSLPDPRRAPKPTSFSYIESRPLGSAHVKTEPPLKGSVAAVIKPLMAEMLGIKPPEAPGTSRKQGAADAVVVKPVVEDILAVKPPETSKSSQSSGTKKHSKILSPTGSMEISPVVAPPPSEASGAAEPEPCKDDKPTSESSSSTSVTSSSEDIDKMMGSSSSSDITPSEGSEGPLEPEKEEEPQLFTEMRAKDGVLYHRHGAICLETQNYPDAVNHRRFPNSLLRPGEVYSHTCIYRFSIQERQYC